MNEIEFKEACQKIGIEVTPDDLKALNKYYQLLKNYNAHTNLTAIIKKEDVYLKHFYDSLTVKKYYKTGSKILDFGTGAGFPGLVLAIFDQRSHFTLLDSIAKKTKFLEQVTSELKLTNVKIVTTRVEDYAREVGPNYDAIVVRAVSKLNILLELSFPLLKIGGSLISLKGNSTEEITLAKSAINILKAKLTNNVNFKLPKTGDKRSILIFEKTTKTSPKYPREFKQIKKNPL